MNTEENNIRRCNECGKELPNDEHKSLCDHCQNKKASPIRKIGGFILGIGMIISTLAKKG